MANSVCRKSFVSSVKGFFVTVQTIAMIIFWKIQVSFS